MDDKLIKIIVLVAVLILFIIFALFTALIVIGIKEKKEKEQKLKNEQENLQVKKPKITYNMESILDFMEFEKIENNMIIQKNDRFLMVVECQGINYDLMSEIEKVSVEQGFVSFLNTLRYPIQLYIQTRTINLERSINGYKLKLDKKKKDLLNLQIKYEKALKNKESDKKDIEALKYDLVKQKNLRDYTADIIRDVERQSLNKSILSRKYYVIIPCYKSEIANGEFNKEEVENMAFSELYTRARAIINSLFACEVNGKILNSEELVELLYVAYNRDEADLDKMREAGFDELYSTAPDVLKKKSKVLDKQIEEKAAELANEKIDEARRDIEIEVLEKERKKDKIIKEKAEKLVKKHKKYIGEEISNKAIEKIKEENDIKKSKEDTKNATIQEKGTKNRK